MRSRPAPHHLPDPTVQRNASIAQTLKKLLPYLWQYKTRVVLALLCVVAAKVANVGVPILLKQLVDAMTPQPMLPTAAQVALVVPVGLIVAYGLLRFSTALFTELREWVFAKATQGTTRTVALQTFRHLHALSLRFHLSRQMGGVTRDIERGVRGIESLISYSLYSIFPTIVEVALVLAILGSRFDLAFVWITLAALAAYMAFTISVTEWRTQFRQQANLLDSQAHTVAVDALINHETVKYFNNEEREAQRYDTALLGVHQAKLKSQSSLSLLNCGQQLIIACALVAMLYLATQGVAQGRMSLGDLVMVNAFMIQLYIPLNFLGVIYRELKQNTTDLERMFNLLDENAEVQDRPNAIELLPSSSPELRFESVDFAYETDRPILQRVSLHIPAGKTVAVVGASGSGKSTLARLLYRFYDVQAGSVQVAGRDVRDYSQASLRRAIGIVPQDTVLFNDSIGYNIAYGRVGATQAEVEAAARAAQIHDFIAKLPKGYDTPVGERGLKLSGGEKQRVAIARTLLKNPAILVLDEATSALDSANERAIQAQLEGISASKTTLIIAHRLSTIVHAHEIVVMDAGRIVERGTHEALLALGGKYASMWALQQKTA
ncbi:MAG: ABCB family ABC transporter ATP-binding protein/permease [Brachymonas sp.]